ncbi:MAG: hypothetical protein ACYDEY_12115 [Acidimicrobiales bacterium]
MGTSNIAGLRWGPVALGRNSYLDLLPSVSFRDARSHDSMGWSRSNTPVVDNTAT